MPSVSPGSAEEEEEDGEGRMGVEEVVVQVWTFN